jgi:hypothetical protein
MSYVVTDLSPVNHNGAKYEEGQSIPDLTPKQAAPLVALGVIRETTPPPPEEATPPPVETTPPPPAKPPAK